MTACLPFLLEAGYSARTGPGHAELLALPQVAIDARAEQRALDAQHRLARVGHHRLPPVDLLQAALAERHELAIVHYDRDYDVLARRTDLRFESVWLAPRGKL